MRTSFAWFSFSSLALCAAFFAGCAESVTSKDVDAARKKSDQEHHEAAQARAQSPDDPEKIAEKDADAREADRKLRETEVKAAATTARDAFVTDTEARLMAADMRIDALKKTADAQTGPAKDDTNKKVDDIKMHRDRVKDALSKLKTADLLQWEQHRAEVQRLIGELNAAMS